ncbi:hypothetical protein XIS1_920020 [Xenorhabdus innexi]|uniref:Uncharacterized protein n=1 Tax=Xenorhabdus innexi TaxID=290109 RepID=A0A1N6N202_9GAMM|nr:hypothetical protein XIS1_920020 [Xenorhabdus innexi]
MNSIAKKLNLFGKSNFPRIYLMTLNGEASMASTTEASINRPLSLKRHY